MKLLTHYFEFLNVFDQTKVSKLSSVWDSNKNHKIELILNEKNQTLNSFWDSLYSMSHDELLILRKILTDLLNKRFIQVSNSSAAASVLFVKKSDSDLRFYVNYQELNKIIWKDHYLLSLINETLK